VPSLSRPAGGGLRRHLAIAFVLALIFYITSFWAIEHRRTMNGPWEIEFISDASGRPSLGIFQSKLNISEHLAFPDDKIEITSLSTRVVFRGGNSDLPFGQMLLQDALYLPGTLTLRVCGHQVEVLPRALIIDKSEHAWQTGGEIVVSRSGMTP